jgi:hypothetical protein
VCARQSGGVQAKQNRRAMEPVVIEGGNKAYMHEHGYGAGGHGEGMVLGHLSDS